MIHVVVGDAHETHDCPLAPQASSLRPSTHWPCSLQQPMGQVVASQVDTHRASAFEQNFPSSQGRRNASRSHRGLHRVWCRNRAGKACRAGFHRSSNVRAGRRAHRRRYPSRKRRGIGNDIFRRRLRWYSSPGSFPVRRELGLLSRLHRSHRRFQTLPRSRTNPRRRKCPPFPTRLPDCCQRFRRPYHPRIYRPRHRQRCPRHHRATRQASCHRRPSRGKGFGGRCRHCYRTRDKYREGM